MSTQYSVWKQLVDNDTPTRRTGYMRDGKFRIALEFNGIKTARGRKLRKFISLNFSNGGDK